LCEYFPEERNLSVAAISRTIDERPAVTHPRRVGRAVDATVDVVMDSVVLAFASWTVLYHVGLIFDLRTDPLLAVWVLSLPMVLWLLMGTRGVRPNRDGSGGALPVRTLFVPAVGLAVAAALLTAFGNAWQWWLGWALAAVSAALGLMAVPHQRHRRLLPADPGDHTARVPGPAGRRLGLRAQRPAARTRDVPGRGIPADHGHDRWLVSSLAAPVS
jgi:hypothetical protein